MAFNDDTERGDELEEFGDEISSDYREEEGLGEGGEELEEEVSYEAEEKMAPAEITVTPPIEESPVAATRVTARVVKPARKAKATKRPVKKPAKKASAKARKPAPKPKKKVKVKAKPKAAKKAGSKATKKAKRLTAKKKSRRH